MRVIRSGSSSPNFCTTVPPKLCPNKGDVFEAALLNVGNDSADAVLVPDSVPYCLWPVPREGRSIRHVPFSGKMAHDALPCPSAMP
jgi:hypothetical protein